ncbi:hypothetical protein COV53_05650 [Candidatus Gottesmanbacteria bacterium CG11_big_fil_rev_8_21_14_0_20_37_11]|uniref:Uncharacterized protein n=3 Tax=Candidatus Gottesmaniibacteriota TaxID=1752720 RepID=A0A2M7RQG0_9BACT|nr:MAG: hypothetical protein AUJ73_02985 [Candidatus Gottesmanbacteria bacterium CG1_02_37_22]PIP32773.1 MAG: hypothetical protein COX23_03015 [Candidatus Gottesmanbacteria bacterium CG23_combo_of_CG06-09_8_20_14_all_37_19]PIR07943.1 MAG: hypothetical protein COV53_05650 [Candidatus Gottesmanbacteria bacterium CG11_big_fil_rev_8_21_14_0_20_37_11]PIZ02214.1 MAG: hypothetical protein COY59_05955 [Candidatus Gottesmanbacteria bacterium CG_4_10_14_0_8_um_filter_37_24]
MRKVTEIIFFITILLTFSSFLTRGNYVYADWWSRSEDRPSPPNLPRDNGILPTNPPPVEPTNPPPVVPTTVVPSTDPGNPNPTQGAGGGIGGTTGSDDDPCASGKSYTGPYCGWSPKVVGEGNNTIQNVVASQAVKKRPQVLGLSYTSGAELTLSDIMLFAGILCLGLYVRSKINIRNVQSKKS